MIIISDTSVISGLIIIGEIQILTKLFDEIIIPQAVNNELLNLTKHKNSVEHFLNNNQTIKKKYLKKPLMTGKELRNRKMTLRFRH